VLKMLDTPTGTLIACVGSAPDRLVRQVLEDGRGGGVETSGIETEGNQWRLVTGKRSIEKRESTIGG
jgi:hypothetical protein